MDFIQIFRPFNIIRGSIRRCNCAWALQPSGDQKKTTPLEGNHSILQTYIKHFQITSFVFSVRLPATIPHLLRILVNAHGLFTLWCIILFRGNALCHNVLWPPLDCVFLCALSNPKSYNLLLLQHSPLPKCSSAYKSLEQLVCSRWRLYSLAKNWTQEYP